MGCLQLLAIINKAAMNIVEHMSLLHIGDYSGYMLRSGIAGSSGSIKPDFLRNCKTVFLMAYLDNTYCLHTVEEKKKLSLIPKNTL